MIYGYARVSTTHQKLDRQITNILSSYPKATIIREFYTGVTQNRPQWEKFITHLTKGDTIVFDSVSRMARNSKEGFKDYKTLYESGINLVFLNEPLINSCVLDATKSKLLNVNIETGNIAVDSFFRGNIKLINDFILAIAEEQIKAAFDQAEKEVTDLHHRTAEGIKTARQNGKQIGRPIGAVVTTKLSIKAKAIIERHSIDFGGTLTDQEVMKMIKPQGMPLRFCFAPDTLNP